MKRMIFIWGLLIILLSACTSNVLYSNKEYNVAENKNYIFSWAEANDYEEALFQCKKQIVKCYYSEVLNGDPDEDWLSIMTSIFDAEIVSDFIVKDTGKYHVSIKVSKKKNSHLVKRE